MISYRADLGDRSEVEVAPGFGLAEGSKVYVQVAGGQFELFTKNVDGGSHAWLQDQQDDALVAAMMNQKLITVTGTSKSGEQITEEYGLSGFETAVQQARKMNARSSSFAVSAERATAPIRNGGEANSLPPGYWFVRKVRIGNVREYCSYRFFLNNHVSDDEWLQRGTNGTAVGDSTEDEFKKKYDILLDPNGDVDSSRPFYSEVADVLSDAGQNKDDSEQRRVAAIAKGWNNYFRTHKAEAFRDCEASGGTFHWGKDIVESGPIIPVSPLTR
jgi:hypothetical protein